MARKVVRVSDDVVFGGTDQIRGVVNPYDNRIPFVFTSTLRINGKTGKSIVLPINPHHISWSQEKRITRRDVIDGSRFFHFRDSNSMRNNDVLILTFNGNSGNLSSMENMYAWHDLRRLAREPVLSDNGDINQFYVTYATNAMRSTVDFNYETPNSSIPITLIGQFASTMEFTESSEKPFSIDYSFMFTVFDSWPSLDDVLSSAI